MKKQIGALGEDYSCKYLIDKGYRILHKNYRTKFGEMDIVAKVNNTVVFAEVKTRRSTTYGSPREAVNYKKQGNYYRLAEHYIQNHRYCGDINYRFDVIEVFKTEEGYKIEHIENAF